VKRYGLEITEGTEGTVKHGGTEERRNGGTEVEQTERFDGRREATRAADRIVERTSRAIETMFVP